MKQDATESAEDCVIEHVVLLRGAPPRDEVLWFANQMERKLSKNDHKGHWRNSGFDYHQKRLGQEVKELARALSKFDSGDMSIGTAQRIIDETVDVANFAMFIADLARDFVGGGDK